MKNMKFGIGQFWDV